MCCFFNAQKDIDLKELQKKFDKNKFFLKHKEEILHSLSLKKENLFFDMKIKEK